MQATTAQDVIEPEVIDISSDTDDDDESVIETDAEYYLNLPIDDFNPFLEPPFGPYSPLENLYGEPGGPVEDASPISIAPPTAPVGRPDAEDCYKLFLRRVVEVFPDHCRDQLKKLYDARFADGQGPRSTDAVKEFAMDVILQVVQADKYPKETDRKKNLKRKRSAESDSEDEGAPYMALGREKATCWEMQEARKALEVDFASVPLKYIDQQLKQHGNLYPAYLAIHQAEQTYDSNRARLYQRLAKPRKSTSASDMSSAAPIKCRMEEFSKELLAVRAKREKDEAYLKRKLEAEKADAAMEKECRETGNMIECQCCFTDTPMPKTTHCKDGHFFCLECVLNLAKSRIELSRYDVICMDGSGCKAEFSREERNRFLDSKLLAVLERLQQQAELREANMEDLESCPFCNYAEIYPPVEFNKEFQCRMPDCEALSCRLCKSKSHLPKTCAEYKKEQGISERHIVEEAMTSALLKICPKCKVPILKDGGCNKLVCSQCRCYVCDYCGKDITKESYGHFDPNNGQNPATKKKCPTTDPDYLRNKERIEKAEKEAMAKVRQENPDLSEDDLKVKFSTSVSYDLPPGIPQHHARDVQPGLRRNAIRNLPRFPDPDVVIGGPIGQGVARDVRQARGPALGDPGNPRNILDMPIIHYPDGALGAFADVQYPQLPFEPHLYRHRPAVPPGFPNAFLQQPYQYNHQMNYMGQELRAELEDGWDRPPPPLLPNAGYAAEAARYNFVNTVFLQAEPAPTVTPTPQVHRGRRANQVPAAASNTQARPQADLTPMDRFREAGQANNIRMTHGDQEGMDLQAAVDAIIPQQRNNDANRIGFQGGYRMDFNPNVVIQQQPPTQTPQQPQAHPRPLTFANLYANLTPAQAHLLERAEMEANHAQRRRAP